MLNRLVVFQGARCVEGQTRSSRDPQRNAALYISVSTQSKNTRGTRSHYTRRAANTYSFDTYLYLEPLILLVLLVLFAYFTQLSVLHHIWPTPHLHGPKLPRLMTSWIKGRLTMAVYHSPERYFSSDTSQRSNDATTNRFQTDSIDLFSPKPSSCTFNSLPKLLVSQNP